MCLCCCVCEGGGCNYILFSVSLVAVVCKYIEYFVIVFSLIYRRVPIAQVFEMLLMPWRKNYVYVCPVVVVAIFLVLLLISNDVILLKFCCFLYVCSFDLILLLFYHFLLKFYFRYYIIIVIPLSLII